MDKYVKVPLSNEDARSLKSGDYVYLTGTIYTAVASISEMVDIILPSMTSGT